MAFFIIIILFSAKERVAGTEFGSEDDQPVGPSGSGITEIIS